MQGESLIELINKPLDMSQQVDHDLGLDDGASHGISQPAEHSLDADE